MNPMTRIIVKKATTKLIHGRSKTKKPMSRPNSGSLALKGLPLRQSRKVSHWVAAERPAKRPTASGAAIVAVRRIGSARRRGGSLAPRSGGGGEVGGGWGAGGGVGP